MDRILYNAWEVQYAIKYAIANSLNGWISKPQLRKHLDIKKETQLNQLKSLLVEKSITVEVYVDKIILFYDFNRQVDRPEDEESDEVCDSSDEDSC